MKINKTYLLMVVSIILSGCALLVPETPTLSDGVYRMESNIKKARVERNYGGVSQCKVTIRGTSIKIEPMDEPASGWYEGTITGKHVLLSVHLRTRDPMLEAMQIKQVFEGDIRANDYAEGIMNSYTGTNKFLNGSWTLKKTN